MMYSTLKEADKLLVGTRSRGNVGNSFTKKEYVN